MSVSLSVCYFGASNTNFFVGYMHTVFERIKVARISGCTPEHTVRTLSHCAICTQQHNFPNTLTKCSGNRPDQNSAHNKTCCKLSLYKTSQGCIP